MSQPRSQNQSPLRAVLVVFTVVLVLVGAVVLPPLVNANRFRAKLATSLSAALGRPVQLNHVTLRLLPRPGFAFENLEVAEDPAFGAEPVMRAASVTVGVRLLPLWRGRIEVATISLDQASLNVARNAAGHWNFESLLQRTAQLPATLPTAQHRTSAGPRFPYFEVANGRINFKRGEEKMPVSLTEAEFSLWLETPTEWRLRFKAAPVRTDLDAAYTGEIELAGSVTKPAPGSGAGIRNGQMVLEGSWQHAPLGQLARMARGTQGRWRGDSQLDFALHGTADAAAARLRFRVDGLHRDDFVPANAVEIDTRCTAQLSLLGRTATDANCLQRIGDGQLLLTAETLPLAASAIPPHASLAMQRVPAEWMLNLLRIVRQGISPQLTAQGSWTGSFDVQHDAAGQSRLTGSTEWQHGGLALPELAQPIVLPGVALSAILAPTPSKTKSRAATTDAPATPGLRLRLQPVLVAAGGARPMQIAGDISAHQFDVSLAGPVDLALAAPLLRSLGMARWNVLHSVAGLADVDLQLQDQWASSQTAAAGSPQLTGSVQLHNVIAQTAWLPGPVAVSKAVITMRPGAVLWQGLQAAWAGAKFDGSASKFATCEGAEDCGWRVAVHTPQLAWHQLAGAFQSTGPDRFLDLFRAGGIGGWPVFSMDLTADEFVLGQPAGTAGLPMIVAHANALLVAKGSTVKIQRGSGQSLGGAVEFSGTVAADQGTADISLGLAHAGLAAAGQLFHEKWGHGTVEAGLNWKLGGTGDFTAMLRNAALNGVQPGAQAASPLSALDAIDTWQMAGTFGDGKLTIHRSLLSSGNQQMLVTGTIGYDRKLDLTAGKRHIGGTVAAPALQ